MDFIRLFSPVSRAAAPRQRVLHGCNLITNKGTMSGPDLIPKSIARAVARKLSRLGQPQKSNTRAMPKQGKILQTCATSIHLLCQFKTTRRKPAPTLKKTASKSETPNSKNRTLARADRRQYHAHMNRLARELTPYHHRGEWFAVPESVMLALLADRVPADKPASVH